MNLVRGLGAGESGVSPEIAWNKQKRKCGVISSNAIITLVLAPQAIRLLAKLLDSAGFESAEESSSEWFLEPSSNSNIEASGSPLARREGEQ